MAENPDGRIMTILNAIEENNFFNGGIIYILASSSTEDYSLC